MIICRIMLQNSHSHFAKNAWSRSRNRVNIAIRWRNYSSELLYFASFIAAIKSEEHMGLPHIKGSINLLFSGHVDPKESKCCSPDLSSSSCQCSLLLEPITSLASQSQTASAVQEHILVVPKPRYFFPRYLCLKWLSWWFSNSGIKLLVMPNPKGLVLSVLLALTAMLSIWPRPRPHRSDSRSWRESMSL